MPLPSRVVSALPAGTGLSRFLIAKGLGRDLLGSLEISKAWRDSPQVLATLEAELDVLGKAAVPPGTTSDATFAAPLASYGIATEVLTLLRGASILGQLEGKMRRVPPKTQVARETGAGTGGAWIGEAGSTPIAATAFDTVHVEIYKAGKIVVLSKELLTIGDPIAERTIRDTVVAGVSAYLDGQFLDPAVTLIAGVRPAAITNGAPVIVSTGATPAAINADLAAMVAAITTPGAGLTWIMRKRTMATIAGALGAASGLPATLWGLPVIVSDTSPAQITLVDAGQILYSDDGAIALDTSESALLQMDSAPVDPPVAATVMTSLFEFNLWAVRAIRWLAYLRARDGSVVSMAVAY